jgi:hypothetical protein
MTVNLGFRPKPEEEELSLKKQELQRLENRLIELELELTGLKAELGVFDSVYLRTVGIRYAELDEIDAQIAELLARHTPDNPRAQGAAREARARAEESRTGATGGPVKEITRFSASPSLKNLYREVARRIHPDLAVDDSDRAKRQRLMADANRAYENGDEARLRAILEEYESSPESVFGQGSGVELVRIIRKIAQVKRRLGEIEAELQTIRTSDVFDLKKRVDEGTQQGRDVLGEMAAAVKLRIDERQAELGRIQEARK